MQALSSLRARTAIKFHVSEPAAGYIATGSSGTAQLGKAHFVHIHHPNHGLFGHTLEPQICIRRAS